MFKNVVKLWWSWSWRAYILFFPMHILASIAAYYAFSDPLRTILLEALKLKNDFTLFFYARDLLGGVGAPSIVFIDVLLMPLLVSTLAYLWMRCKKRPPFFAFKSKGSGAAFITVYSLSCSILTFALWGFFFIRPLIEIALLFLCIYQAPGLMAESKEEDVKPAEEVPSPPELLS